VSGRARVDRQRLVFGSDAELYDRVRPAYPAELIDDVVSLVGLPCTAVDAGAGTGKATVLLAGRGARGVAVEPDPAMADVAERNLRACAGWRVDVSDFEAWRPKREDGAFDLVTCAQAWHWIDRERGARAAARALRPGGWLAIFTSTDRWQDTPLRRAIDAAYDRRPTPTPPVQLAPRERVPPGLGFSAPLEREYPGTRTYSSSAWVDLMRTSSDHKMLPSRRREELLAEVRAAIDAHGGRYDQHYVIRLWAARRL
jgi:SAM-dependent methyltransferase